MITALYELLDATSAEDWQQDALCAQVDADLFFPEKGGSTETAKRVCSLCDVRAECLAYAQREVITFGVWGGLSERERERMRVKARKPRASRVEVDERVVALTAAGETARRIAEELSVSTRTVQRARSRTGCLADAA